MHSGEGEDESRWEGQNRGLFFTTYEYLSLTRVFLLVGSSAHIHTAVQYVVAIRKELKVEEVKVEGYSEEL